MWRLGYSPTEQQPRRKSQDIRLEDESCSFTKLQEIYTRLVQQKSPAQTNPVLHLEKNGFGNCNCSACESKNCATASQKNLTLKAKGSAILQRLMTAFSQLFIWDSEQGTHPSHIAQSSQDSAPTVANNDPVILANSPATIHPAQVV